MTDQDQRPYGRRWLRDQRGAAVVELSISVVLLLTLVFGIVTFGMILSFKQGLTQAAAEGARSGAMGDASTAPGLASTSAAKSVNAFGKTCGSGGLTCTYNVAPCVPGPPSAKCITVEMVYDYDHYPLLPKMPLIGGLVPSTLRSKSVSEVNS